MANDPPPARPAFRKLAATVCLSCCILAGLFCWFRPEDGLFTPAVCLVVALIMGAIAATGSWPPRRNKTLPLLALGFAALGAADAPKLPPASTAKIDFDKDVRPLLTSHCVKCHGADKAKGGLRLDDAKHLAEGGNSGAVLVSGKSAESRLIHAIAGIDADLKMPPEGPALSATQVGTLRAWIDQGAKWGDGPIASASAKSNHWSFQPIKRPAVPETAGHPVDAFVRARLVKEGLKASVEADKETLLRRVTLDLIGLPPTSKEIDAYLEDNSPEAYEKVVDRLLASPHFGERWGRHWLDAARYADSDGYEKDTGRPFAWRYREWVILAFNSDMPFDHFTVEQLAGDLLPNPTLEQKIATGFHRNTLTNKEGGADQEEFRVAACVDRVNTTGKVWLGLTVGCCQCHDHKYDPLSQREYYQLFAYFNSDRETDLEAPLPSDKDKKSASKVMTLSLGSVKPTHVMIRGDFLRKGVAVKPGTPQVIASPAVATAEPDRLSLAKWIVAPENPLTSRVTVNWVWSKLFGRGIVSTPEDFGTQGAKPSHPELLDWLASEFRNPAKPADGRPWALKRLVKLVVTSATYKQSSAVAPEHLARDPLNILLARQSRLRLEAEIVRDSALAASGLLNRTVGGPSIRPPQPAGISELTYANSAKWLETVGPEKYKRGLYIWFQRTSPYPMLTAFDSPDGNVCAVRRERSNTPLQALTMLNDLVFVEAAQALAKRVLTEAKDEPSCHQIDLAFRLALGREPTRDEYKRLAKLLIEFQKLAKADLAASTKLLGSHKPEGVPVADAAGWVGLCRTILNLDEFVTRE